MFPLSLRPVKVSAIFQNLVINQWTWYDQFLRWWVWIRRTAKNKLCRPPKKKPWFSTGCTLVSSPRRRADNRGRNPRWRTVGRKCWRQCSSRIARFPSAGCGTVSWTGTSRCRCSGCSLFPPLRNTIYWGEPN